MKVVRLHGPLDGWPWGWGAERVGPAIRACDQCHKHQRGKDASLLFYRDGRIALCANCARKVCQRAVGRRLTGDEERAIYDAEASYVAVMSDHLATLFTNPARGLATLLES